MSLGFLVFVDLVEGRRGAQRLARPGRGASTVAVDACGTDFPVVLGSAVRRVTRFVRDAHCARTDATSQFTKRAARATANPAFLGATEARPDPSGQAFAQARPHAVTDLPTPSAASAFSRTVMALPARQAVGGRGEYEAARSAALGAARTQCALCELTCRRCLSAVSDANEASSAARPQSEHRSEVGTQCRPPNLNPGCLPPAAPHARAMKDH